MIDTHCHIDIYKQPLEVAKTCEREQIRTVAVTHLPSHYFMAEQHLKNFKFVRPALGMHPLSAKDHKKELAQFTKAAITATLIGEIGLDFSSSVLSTRVQQEESFATILHAIRGKKRFITLHSRRAEDAVLAHLRDAEISSAVFHWFSGTRAQMLKILDAGHYFSMNVAMTKTDKWQELIRLIPKDRLLTESDGPFAKIDGNAALPESVGAVLQWLSVKWSDPIAAVEEGIQNNFDHLIDGIFPKK